MPVILSILEHDADATARRLEAVPSGCERVEIRADLLAPGDIEGLVRRSPRPVIVAARRPRDGGLFERPEDERRALLERARAAGADIDVELGGPAADLLEPHPERTVLSWHGSGSEGVPLHDVYEAMLASGARRLKIVPRAERLADCAEVRDLLGRARREGTDLTSFATGAAGTPSRILALAWGSSAVYGAAAPDRATGEGQIPARELLEVHDVQGIGPRTRLLGLAGSPLSASPSPAMHDAALRACGLDARYLPLETRSLDDLASAIAPDGPFPVEGFGVTTPLKQEAAARCRAGDDLSRHAGAVNTVRCEPGGGWVGFNTDGPAVVEVLRAHGDVAGRRVAVAGAGGAARGVASALAASGAVVTIHARDGRRAEEAAQALGVGSAGWAALGSGRWDVLVNATPLGRQGEQVVDAWSLTGSVVVELVYRDGGVATPLVRAARGRGLRVVGAVDVLVGQAVLQFEILTGAATSARVMRRAAESWLASAP